MEPENISQPQLIANTTCVTGENPLWHPQEQRLYWVDIPSGHIYCYEPGTGYRRVFNAQTAVGGFTFEADGSLLLFMAGGAIKKLRGGLLTTVVESLPGVEDSRFNDVFADPEGRVYAGVMPTGSKPGSLYRVDQGGACTKILDGLGIPNGMGFSPDLSIFYFTDSTNRVIWQFDYDRGTGALTNQRVLVRTPNDISMPDGMTVDREGHIWSARWDGSKLYRYSPSGEEELSVAFPAKKVSSMIFGGQDYRTAYVTTAGGQDRATEGAGAGAVFQVDLGVGGSPEFASRITG